MSAVEQQAAELGATVNAHRESPFVGRLAAALADAERRGEQRLAQAMEEIAQSLLDDCYDSDRTRCRLVTRRKQRGAW